MQPFEAAFYCKACLGHQEYIPQRRKQEIERRLASVVPVKHRTRDETFLYDTQTSVKCLLQIEAKYVINVE
jgi:hypothetical protein